MSVKTIVDFRYLGEGFDPVYLTTEHPASSYGQPVLIMGGKAHGPLDLVDDCVTAKEWLEIQMEIQNPGLANDPLVKKFLRLSSIK